MSLRSLIKLSAFLPTLLLTSCLFTGIESTPRITESDVKRQDAATTTEEERFFDGIATEPIAEWAAGKRFVVTSDRINLITRTSGVRLAAGDTIAFSRLTSVTGITGNAALDVELTTSRGDTIVYRANDAAASEMPFVADLDVVAAARERLLGRRLYIITSLWRDSADTPVKGRKFVPVKITAVEAGTADYPVRVDFIETDGDTPAKGSAFITPRSDSRGSRTFAAQFMLRNPREMYPAVNPDHWAAISDGKVARGMTRLECRLALGAPADLDRLPGYSAMHERWVYDNGISLIFEDGILVDYRR